MAEKPTVCLVDGSGYIFRAFYALPQMIRQDGTPVNAVYGFTNMMMNLTHENSCGYMVVVFDAKRQNFRNDIYPAYKENRKETTRVASLRLMNGLWFLETDSSNVHSHTVTAMM